MPTIDDYRWLTSAQGLAEWRRLIDSETVFPPSASVLQSLRRTHGETQVALLIDQFRLRDLSKRKFSTDAPLIWTQQLLEQSSDEHTAAESAKDFPVGSTVYDVCCGAGADSIALAKAGSFVTSIDRCQIACEITRHNLKSSGLTADIQQIDLDNKQWNAPENAFVHIDPDRRADGSRTTSLARLSPSWETIDRIRRNCLGMSLKLAPGTNSHPTDNIGASCIPESKRWISRDGSVRQQRWYWGIDRWPKGTVTVSVQAKDLLWQHETFEVNTKADEYSTDVLTSLVGPFVGDYDAGIRASQCSVMFARRYEWRLLDSRHGYITADQINMHPMVRWFTVREVLPMDKRQLRSFARALKVRTWELKSRGIDTDLDAWRKELPVDRESELRATVLFTKLDGRHKAIVATPT